MAYERQHTSTTELPCCVFQLCANVERFVHVTRPSVPYVIDIVYMSIHESVQRSMRSQTATALAAAKCSEEHGHPPLELGLEPANRCKFGLLPWTDVNAKHACMCAHGVRVHV